MPEPTAIPDRRDARPWCAATVTRLVVLLSALLAASAATANDLRVEQVTDGVYAIVGPKQSSSAGWLEAFAAIAAHEPVHVVPGHGAATDLATARAQTEAYLLNIRARMREHIDAGGDIFGAVDVDQSTFAHLEQFDALARRNAQAVFIEMEFE